MTVLVSLSALSPRSGKDTIADALCDKFGGVKLSFAQPLRQDVATFLPNIDNFIELSNGSLKDTKMDILSPSNVKHSRYVEMLKSKGFTADMPMSPRQHLQFYGTDYIKGVLGKDNYWPKKGIEAYKKLKQEGYPLIIFTDTRSQLEFDMLKSLGGIMLLIKRQGFPKDIHDTMERHAAETHAETFDYDHIIHNIYGDVTGTINNTLNYIGKFVNG